MADENEKQAPQEPWFNTGGAQFPALGFVTTFGDPHVVEPVQDPVLAQFAYGPVGAVVVSASVEV